MTAREQFAATVLGKRLVAQIAQVLAPHRIDIMPLKGALLSATVYPPDNIRPMRDVDLLVPPGTFARAQDALLGAGHVVRARSRTAVTLRAPSAPLLIDLHEHLFAPHVFRMDTEGIFLRAQPDDALFGVRVRRMDPYDVYGHLIGHFVKGRLPHDDATHLDDLAQVAGHWKLDAASAASHLSALGLARAAQYVLPLSRKRGDAFAPQVLAAIPRRPHDASLVAFAGAWLRRAPLSPLGAVPAHLLNASLPSAARSLSSQAAYRLRRTSLPTRRVSAVDKLG